MNITLQQIQVFLTVAEHGSFSNAAKNLFITQPAISKLIKKLEDELNTELFIRGNRSVTMTKSGEYYYSEWRPIFLKFNETISRGKELFFDTERTLRIGSHVGSTSRMYLGKYVDEFLKKYPQVELTIEYFEFKELRQALTNGYIDVALSGTLGTEGLMYVSRKKYALMNSFICMHRSHPLAVGNRLDTSNLNDEIFYFVSDKDTQTTTNNELERCNELGFTPKKIIYLSNYTSVVRAVLEKRGMAMIDNVSLDPVFSDIKTFEMPTFYDPPYYVVAWRTNDVSNAALKFISLFPDLEN